MKKIILAVTTLSLFAASCSKTTIESQNSPSPQSDVQTMSAIVTMNDLDAIKSEAYTIHNNYMSAVLSAYQNNTLSTTYSLQNITSHISWASNYFGNLMQNQNAYSSFWTSCGTNMTNCFNTGTLALTLHLSNLQNSPNSAYKNYLYQIINPVIDQINGDTTINLPTIINGIYTSVKTDQTLNVDDKKSLATIIGVTLGSYDFWNTNIEVWPPSDLPEDIDENIQTIRMTAKQSKVALFLMADGMGAMEGAAAGTVLPGVGNVAGAVMGGALYSGLTAWFW